MNCRIFSSILGLYLLDTSNTHTHTHTLSTPPVVTMRSACIHCQISFEVQEESPLVKNHCLRKGHKLLQNKLMVNEFICILSQYTTISLPIPSQFLLPPTCAVVTSLLSSSLQPHLSHLFSGSLVSWFTKEKSAVRSDSFPPLYNVTYLCPSLFLLLQRQDISASLS